METLFVILSFLVGMQMGKFKEQQAAEYRYEQWRKMNRFED